MKKTFLLILAVLLILPLFACESGPAGSGTGYADPGNDWNDPYPYGDPDPATEIPDVPGWDEPAATEIPDVPGWDEPAATEAPAAEQPDPYAYMSRNWEEIMRMPSEEQIRAVRGVGRSPYIALHYGFSGLGRALEYCVDLHADHQPKGTYFCPFNWWLDVSALETVYESVYNDFTGVPGGYCGFQVLADGSHVFIMTEWSAFCRDHDGKVTVFTPQVLYPEGQGEGNGDDSEGTFTHCIVPFDWRAGRDYRVLLQQRRSETTGNAVFTVYVCDLAVGEWHLLVSIDAGIPDVYIRSIGGFSENFLMEYTGEVRTVELSNLRARSAETYQWVSASSARFMLNGSVSSFNYIGSAAFGTDGSSIWAITSGVSGLCPDPPADAEYPLAPGSSADPY